VYGTGTGNGVGVQDASGWPYWGCPPIDDAYPYCIGNAGWYAVGPYDITCEYGPCWRGPGAASPSGGSGICTAKGDGCTLGAAIPTSMGRVSWSCCWLRLERSIS